MENTTATKLAPDHYRFATVHSYAGLAPFTEYTDVEFRNGRVWLRTRWNSIIGDVTNECSIGTASSVAYWRELCDKL